MSSEPKEADATGRESSFGLLFWVVERSSSYKDIALFHMDAPLCSASRMAWWLSREQCKVVLPNLARSKSPVGYNQ